MLKLSAEQLNWICEEIPDAERSPKGGRPPAKKRNVIEGIFSCSGQWREMEGLATPVWQQEHGASVVSKVGGSECLRSAHDQGRCVCRTRGRIQAL